MRRPVEELNQNRIEIDPVPGKTPEGAATVVLSPPGGKYAGAGELLEAVRENVGSEPLAGM